MGHLSSVCFHKCYINSAYIQIYIWMYMCIVHCTYRSTMFPIHDSVHVQCRVHVFTANGFHVIMIPGCALCTLHVVVDGQCHDCHDSISGLWGSNWRYSICFGGRIIILESRPNLENGKSCCGHS